MTLCACCRPDHERPTCPNRHVLMLQAGVHVGLYDDRGIRLLNPGYAGDDATSRHFALLEID